MASFGFATRCLLLSFAAFLLASDSALIKGPRAAGVFMLLEGGRYTFNASAAGAACLGLGVRIATRAQVERALRRGLQTCKYGWIAERIGVVPRLTADPKCGQGKTGVVTWFAKADRTFAVFCFNASDFEETPNSSTLPPTPTRTSPTRTSPPLRSATESPPSMKPGTTEAPEKTSFTSSSTLLIPTTLKPSSTRLPPSLSPLIPSKPSVVGSVFSTSASGVSRSSEPAGSTKPPLGNVLTALIILGVVALLLTAASGVWCYKLNMFTFRSRAPQKDDVETEMRKHTDSEADLQSPHGGGGGGGGGGGEEEEGEEEGEEEADRKYSSDVTLCATPDLKTNPSE